jgi:integrase
MSILTPPSPAKYEPVKWANEQLSTVRSRVGVAETDPLPELLAALGLSVKSSRQAIDEAVRRVLATDDLVDPGDGEAKPKTSKRIGLAKLPRDWREKVFAATERTRQTKQPASKLRCATALIWATGCRPDEIQKGCRVEMQNGKIVVTIPGSKVGEISVPAKKKDGERQKAARGIDKRVLVLNPALHAGTRFLAELAASGPIEVQFEKNAFRTGLHGAAEKALGEKVIERAGGVSPYSFRHAMGADLKSCDTLTDVRRAAIMGHRAVESIAAYGRRRRGGNGGPAPVESVRITAGQTPHGARAVLTAGQGESEGEAAARERG